MCAEVEAEGLGLRAYGLCYLELNAALGTGLGTDWPVTVDHGSTMETSWVAALAPELVATDAAARRPGRRRSSGSTARIPGSRPMPAAAAPRSMPPRRCSPSVPRGSCAAKRSTRWPTCARSSSATGPSPWALPGRPATLATAAIGLTNPGPVSRYLSGLTARMDGESSRPRDLILVNTTAGETGVPFRVDELGPEHGFYVRRQQTATLRLGRAVSPGTHAVELTVRARRGDRGASRAAGRVRVTDAGPLVRTVLGPVAPSALGITSSHEHLWMDSTPLLAVHGYQAAQGRRRPGTRRSPPRRAGTRASIADNYRLTDVAAAVEELAPFIAAGGRTIVELTPPTLGRDVRRVAEIAALAGIHVVQGTGQYLAPVHAPWVAAATSDDELVERLLIEIRDGIDDTGIRPGILGEIGTSDPVAPAERRVLRAVAAAASTSGLAVSVHSTRGVTKGRRCSTT